MKKNKKTVQNERKIFLILFHVYQCLCRFIYFVARHIFLFVCCCFCCLFQETDASLLMITGFPAFAVSDASLCKKAKDIVLEKLEVRS